MSGKGSGAEGGKSGGNSKENGMYDDNGGSWDGIRRATK